MRDAQPETPAGVRSYGGVPAHERVAARRERLIEAASRLFGEQGVAATTVRGTCDAAGLSQRYFYESFRSVEALAIAVADRIADEIIAAAFDAVADDEEVGSRAHVIFRTLVDHIAADPGAGRIIFIESAGNGADLAAWRREMIVRAATLNENWFRQSASTDEPATQGTFDERIAALVITGGVVETIVAWLEGDVEATPAELSRALAQAVGMWSDSG